MNDQIIQEAAELVADAIANPDKYLVCPQCGKPSEITNSTLFYCDLCHLFLDK